MDATLVKDIGVKALLAGGAVLVSFWTFNAVKLVIKARGINPLVRKFFDQIAAGRIDAANKSLADAINSDNQSYVKMNKESIDKWAKNVVLKRDELKLIIE